MNELISQEKKYEIINQVLEFLDSDKPINDISEYLEDEIRNINKNHKDIGLKDINGKNIYADSSIVEFNNSTNLNHKYKGIFYYLPAKARYMIKVFNKNNFEIWFYNPDKILNLKIVDTVQQNKLGLIK